MNVNLELQKAIDIVGLVPLAEELGGTYQMIRKWQSVGSMPSTEYSGKTKYSWVIEDLCDGAVTVESILGFRPPFHDEGVEVNLS